MESMNYCMVEGLHELFKLPALMSYYTALYTNQPRYSGNVGKSVISRYTSTSVANECKAIRQTYKRLLHLITSAHE
jgi:hypothetical protein